MKTKYFSTDPLVTYGVILLRVWLGVIMIKHSYSVLFGGGIPEYVTWIDSLGFPLPEIFGRLSKYTEFWGGIGIILGFQTRLFSGLLAINMLMAVLTAGEGKIFSGAELAFDYFLISITVFLYGSGNWSLDRIIQNRKESVRLMSQT